jgi:oligosaccharide repeat unit polymerase
VMGLDSTGLLDRYFSAETTLASLYLVATSLAGMHLGALLALPKGRFPAVSRLDPDSATSEALRRTGFVLLAVSIAPAAILTARAIGIVMQRGYFGLYEQTAGAGLAAGPQILAAFLVPALLCLIAGGEELRGYRAIAVAIAVIYSGVQLALGARFGGTAPLIALVWLWDRSVRPLSRKVMLAVALIAVFVLFPLVGVTRNTALTERGSIDLTEELTASDQNYFASAIVEFGGTIKTISYTIDLVPTTRPYDYGLQYIYSLLTVVPNVFGGVHPAVARGTPSSWLIWSVDPTTAAAGGGFGFSFIAEAFLNFGLVGAYCRSLSQLRTCRRSDHALSVRVCVCAVRTLGPGFDKHCPHGCSGVVSIVLPCLSEERLNRLGSASVLVLVAGLRTVSGTEAPPKSG